MQSKKFIEKIFNKKQNPTGKLIYDEYFLLGKEKKLNLKSKKYFHPHIKNRGRKKISQGTFFLKNESENHLKICTAFPYLWKTKVSLYFVWKNK